ncbi:elongation factor P-like protein YeiP [Dasania sp. GY-MA-18]|uniref:Elongation factor P-like protein n=1 Tax=Dasania phycosphaerae TaxID=2950436 RepID=A0A9J6RQ04_9GAMM|nr:MULTISPECIES: elongation factor P-like protein YeiP [Dasania]MCR8923951.1 elongation factor P-like protein YeiP [Dasania sp. GY-MA-18]MCZ0866385.1 elongation factor P-like protein YeiP [Dasania phycosphaerae]MCZ0870109.1 elongation factor P-like protein YeiP [Dasania phycosphaerae]
MPKASDLKKGDVVAIKGAPHIVKHIEVKSPSSRGSATLYKIRFKHAQTGQKVDESLKGDDMLADIDFERRKMQYSFRDGEAYVFMDDEDYSQHSLTAAELGDDRYYIVENMESVVGMLVAGQLLGIELPQSVAMTISETSPGIKGASASARTKPAHFVTGLVIQVPEYIDVGETVKINTEDNRFMSRA